MKPFARVAQNFDKDERIAALPSDITRYAFFLTILEGKKVGGRWESRAHWEALIGRQRRSQLQRLIDAGLVEELASGAVRIPPEKWRTWQTDPTGVKRQAEFRARQKGESNGHA